MRRISASAAAASGGPCFRDLSETNPAGDLAMSALPMTTQAAAEFVETARVEDVLGANPGAPRHLHAPTQAIECRYRMRIGRDDQRYAAVAGQPRVGVAEIETLRLAVDFHRHAALPGGSDNRRHVHLCRLALEQPASRRMAEHIDPWALQRPQDAIGHLLLILREVRVD